MATFSEMKSGLDAIAVRIREQREVMKKVKSNAQGTSAALQAITVDYADVIATIDAIPANTTNTAEQLLKADKAKLATEFTALKAKADTVAAIDMNT